VLVGSLHFSDIVIEDVIKKNGTYVCIVLNDVTRMQSQGDDLFVLPTGLEGMRDVNIQSSPVLGILCMINEVCLLQGATFSDQS